MKAPPKLKPQRLVAADLQPASGVTKYVQLASLLRANVVKGIWKVGDKLPTVADLADQHEVALVTVRQALHLLVEEGLVSSSPGRGTFVSRVPEAPSDSLRSAINDPHAALKTSQIRVLSKQRGVELPPALGVDGQPATNYVLMRKMHLHNQVPFCVMDLYVAQDVFDRFPKGSEVQKKINGLLLELMPEALASAHTLMTVEPADYQLSTELRYSFGAPVARIVRSIIDVDGCIVYAGIFWYRGDRFVLDMRMPAKALLDQPEQGAPVPKS